MNEALSKPAVDKSNGTGCAWCGFAYSLVFNMQFHAKDCPSQR